MEAIILFPVPLPLFQPLPLDRARSAFSHPDWLFEVKWDGFRSLVYIDDGECKLVSRNGNQFKSFAVLNESLPAELSVSSAVLDGEIVCLDEDGRPQFRDLLFRRGQPRFMAFDLLFVNAEDWRYSRLIDRKHRLREIVPKEGEQLLYCDHVEHDGEGLFRLACDCEFFQPQHSCRHASHSVRSVNQPLFVHPRHQWKRWEVKRLPCPEAMDRAVQVFGSREWRSSSPGTPRKLPLTYVASVARQCLTGTSQRGLTIDGNPSLNEQFAPENARLGRAPVFIVRRSNRLQKLWRDDS